MKCSNHVPNVQSAWELSSGYTTYIFPYQKHKRHKLKGSETMPYKPPKPCAHPGCPELVRDGRYCAKHKRQVNADYNSHRRDKTAQSFYDSPQWRRLRKMKLNAQPLCEECHRNGRFTPARHVDHIKEISHGGAPLDMANLQSLCHSCHSSKTLRERHTRPQPPSNL